MDGGAPNVHAALLEAIRAGRHAPGARLPNERDLAASLGASRSQVRDALLILQEAGLVRRRVGAGTWLVPDAPRIIERLDAEVDVTAAHEHSFLETVEARLILEPGAAALAARNLTPERAARLDDALAGVLEAPTWLAYKSRLYLFARVIYEASGNSFLLWAFDQILKARLDHRFDGQRENGAVAEIVRRHAHDQLRAIRDAVAARDEGRAEALTRAYLVGIAASAGQG